MAFHYGLSPVSGLQVISSNGLVCYWWFLCPASPVNNLTLILIPSLSPSFFSTPFLPVVKLFVSHHSYRVHACRPQSLRNQHMTILTASFYLPPDPQLSINKHSLPLFLFITISVDCLHCCLVNLSPTSYIHSTHLARHGYCVHIRSLLVCIAPLQCSRGSERRGGEIG